MTHEPSAESILCTMRETYENEETQNTTTVYFICSKCSLPYRTTQRHRAQQVSGVFDCLNCREHVHGWSGFYDFVDWTPERPERPKGRRF